MSSLQISNITYNLNATDFIINGSSVYIKDTILAGNPGLLLVWADFCGHCHRFIPTFKELNTRLNQNGQNFACLAIENNALSKNSNISETLNIQGFPTLLWVDQNGKILGQYDEARNMSTLLQQVCKVYHHCILEH